MPFHHMETEKSGKCRVQFLFAQPAVPKKDAVHTKTDPQAGGNQRLHLAGAAVSEGDKIWHKTFDYWASCDKDEALVKALAQALAHIPSNVQISKMRV
jgi:hypothetical protein